MWWWWVVVLPRRVSGHAELSGEDEDGSTDEDDVLAERRGADHEARGADRHGPHADAAVGGLQERAVEQLRRAAQHELVQVERPDDRRQRGAELLADATEDLGRVGTIGEPPPEVRHGED